MKLRMRLFKRGKIWYCETIRNKRRSLRTVDESEAKALYRIIKRKTLEGKIAELDSDKRISLADFKRIFQERHKDLAEDTISAYDLAMRLFIDSVGGSTMLSRSLGQIDKFKSDCRARGVKKVSVNSYLRHLRGWFNKAHKWGYLKKKPEIELYKIGQRHPRILLKDEIDLLLLHSQKCHFEMHRIIKFALWTGCRRGEIHGLKWQNVKGDFCTVIGKGNKERTIPLLVGSIEALGPHKDIGPVFLQCHIDGYSKKFKQLVRDCEIEDVHFHQLRHTAATQMLMSGISLESVQKLLGHCDISTTQIYAQVLQEKLKEEMQKMRY